MSADMAMTRDNAATAGPLTLARDGVTLWRQIAGALERDITGRVCPPGAQLPTEMALAERFGVNRHTVRRAIAALETAGLVRVERGRGMFVQTRKLDYTIGRRTRFGDIVRGQAMDPAHELIRTERLRADADVARALKLRAGTEVLLIESLGTADGVPIALGLNYFPARRCRGLLEHFAATRSVTESLKRLGIADYIRQVTRVSARLPTAHEAHYLRVPGSHPVLITEAVNVDESGRPIEYGIARVAATRANIVIDKDLFVDTAAPA